MATVRTAVKSAVSPFALARTQSEAYEGLQQWTWLCSRGNSGEQPARIGGPRPARPCRGAVQSHHLEFDQQPDETIRTDVRLTFPARWLSWMRLHPPPGDRRL